jgi:hypothetical protein
VKDVLDILCHMGQELADASARFEQSADRAQLRTDVYNACGPVWTWIALWAAEHRDADEVGQVPDDIEQLKISQRYIGPAWQTTADALRRLPVAVHTPPETLHQAAKGVAKAVAKSLEHIGFRHTDNPYNWQETFTVLRQDFPSARE